MHTPITHNKNWNTISTRPRSHCLLVQRSEHFGVALVDFWMCFGHVFSQRYSRGKHFVAVRASHVFGLVEPGVQCRQLGVQFLVVANQSGLLLEGFPAL